MASIIDNASADNHPARFPGGWSPRIALVLSTVFLLGWLGAKLIVHWPTLVDLYVESNLARYHAMTSQSPGPAVYYVLHNNREQLQAIVAAEPEALSVESTGYGNLLKVTMTSERAGAIQRLRDSDAVYLIMNGSLPLFCH
jgi:hypothetical protein